MSSTYRVFTIAILCVGLLFNALSSPTHAVNIDSLPLGYAGQVTERTTTPFSQMVAPGQYARITINNAAGSATAIALGDSHPAVVELAMGPFLCTGTLIDSTHVLTAEHCSNGIAVGSMTVFFHHLDNNATADASRSVTAKAEYVPTNNYLDGTDLTILTLGSAAPAGVTPLLLHPVDLNGVTATMVGFGLNGLGNSGHGNTLDGRRWAAENVIDSVGPARDQFGAIGGTANIFNTDFDDGTPGNNNLSGVGSSASPLVNEGTTAGGDSGGPLLVNGHIAGALSGGTTASSTVGDVSWWTGTAAAGQRSFIEANAPGAVYANDSVLSVDTGTTSTPIEFGDVLVGQTPTAELKLDKTGVEATTYSVTASDNGLSDDATGAFAAGTQSETFEFELQNNANGSATAGARAFTVTVDNLAAHSALADQGSADSNEVFNVTASILDHSEGSLNDSLDLDLLNLDFGDVLLNSSPADLSFGIFNIEQTTGFTATLDLLSINGSGDTGTLTTNLALFDQLAADDSNDFLASIDTSSLGSFSATYILGVADDQTLDGAEAGTSLTLNILGNVVLEGASQGIPEPGSLTLLLLSLVWFSNFRRR